ncbi:hypothetical protein OROHE_014368 [Orobanche hederae]
MDSPVAPDSVMCDCWVADKRCGDDFSGIFLDSKNQPQCVMSVFAKPGQVSPQHSIPPMLILIRPTSGWMTSR